MCPDKERVLTMRCAVNEKAAYEEVDPPSMKKMEEESRIKGVKEDRTSPSEDSSSSDRVEYVPKIKWLDLSAQIFIHGGCLYGFYLMFTQAKLLTSLWAFIIIYTSGFGITAGAHRLWSHRAYKAKWPLRLLLVFLFTITGQKHVYAWALDHRVHHKYSETDADPHNAKRGFFFAHVGWLFTTPHPDVVAKRKVVDMSDLEADPIVMWQKRFYIPLFALLTIGLPVAVPYYLWSETFWTSFWVSFNFRFCVTLNIAFFVNSVAHMWGQKPYDKNISPVENIAVSIAALGEGWHNYHHVFPWDYKTGELGDYSFNITTGFIDAFARIGWAYDRKYVSPEMVRRRANKSGDGSHVWGYGDVDIPKEDLQELEMMDKKFL
ncbi:acyl-CoA Delta-9 desaturase [Vespula squamosa]|uniref:Acyl-CoA Delta-9 desaturase n=1 Tax=Vespula squamosa TaxID=30214 RepID=A0ABD2A4P9_VESSQ